MRIQFEIDDSFWKRMSRYAFNPKMRHLVAHQALEEWVNRKEGRDKKLQAERLMSDKDTLRPILRELLEEV